MASYSIGEALQILLDRNKWSPKITEMKLRHEWPSIMGKTIAKYTKHIYLKNSTLVVYTDVAALKQELHFGKDLLITRINEYLGGPMVKEIIVK